MSRAIPVTLVGCTGLTGSTTLTALMQSLTPFDITCISRRSLPEQLTPKPVQGANGLSSSFTVKVTPDLFAAPNSTVAAQDGVYISCLGTTRAAAGGVADQRKVDVDLNKTLAEKAKADGARTMILVSSRGASSSSSLAYPKMKGDLEDAVTLMGFEHSFILRPGFLIGGREGQALGVTIGQNLFKGLRAVGLPMNGTMTDGVQVGLNADSVGQCIALLAANPTEYQKSSDNGVTILDSQSIIELAQEWRTRNQRNP